MEERIEIEKKKNTSFGVKLMRSHLSYRAAQVYVAVIGQLLATASSPLTWSAVIHVYNHDMNRVSAGKANQPPQRATKGVI